MDLKKPFTISILLHGAVILAGALAFPQLGKQAKVITQVLLLDSAPAAAERKTASVEKALPAPTRKPEVKNFLPPVPKPVVRQPTPPAAQKTESDPGPVKAEEAAQKTETADRPVQIPLEAAPAAAISTARISAPQTNIQPETRNDAAGGKKPNDEMARFKSFIISRIERVKVYPKWARDRGFEGVVKVMFTVNPDGSVTGMKVVQPCVCEVLNKAACEAIEKAGPFPMPKMMEAKAIAMELTVPFKLRD